MIKITLTSATRQELNKEKSRAVMSGNLKYLDRLRFVEILPYSIKLEEIAKIFQKTVRCLYQWKVLFLTQGISGLKYKERQGKKKKLSKYLRKKLVEMIKAGPEAQGFKSGLWTSAMIQELIYKRFGVEYSVNYIPQLLREMGLSHKKVNRISHKANPYEQQCWEEIEFPRLVRESIDQGAEIMFQDESTAMMWSQSGYSWGIIGEKIIAEVNMNNINRKVFGAVALATGKLYYRIYEQANKKTFNDYLNYLSKKYTRIFLIIDNGPIHKVTPPDNIKLFRLPPYSPVLNPIEKLWKKLKCNSLHSRCFNDERHFVDGLKEGLHKIKSEPLAVLSVMKKWKQIYDNVLKNYLTFRQLKTLKLNYFSF